MSSTVALFSVKIYSSDALKGGNFKTKEDRKIDKSEALVGTAMPGIPRRLTSRYVLWSNSFTPKLCSP